MMTRYEISFNTLLTKVKNSHAIFGELLIFCSVCLSVLQEVHTLFIAWGGFEKNKLDHTGSKISMESYLNDQFDLISRRIYIETLNRIPLRYIMDEDEEPDLYLFDDGDPYMDYIYDDLDYQAGGRIDHSFVVWLPAAIMAQQDEVRSVVNFFRLFGKTFIIQQIGGTLSDFEDENLFSI